MDLLKGIAMQSHDIEETFVAPEHQPILMKAMVAGVISIDDMLGDVYMYIYSTSRRHYIKHRDTREYINFTR